MFSEKHVRLFSETRTCFLKFTYVFFRFLYLEELKEIAFAVYETSRFFRCYMEDYPYICK